MSYTNNVSTTALGNWPLYSFNFDQSDLETIGRALSTQAVMPSHTLGDLENKIKDLVEQNNYLRNFSNLNGHLHLQQQYMAANKTISKLNNENTALIHELDYLNQDNEYCDCSLA